MTSTNRLISFEGMEGAGKSTQAKLIEAKLLAFGHEVLVVREPGGTAIAEQIRDVVLSPLNTAMDNRAELLLFQAARAQLYGELIFPALEKNTFVLMDRTRDSSSVFQGIVRGFGLDLVEKLNDYSTSATVPTLTFLLDVSVEVGLDRRKKSGKMDRLDHEGVDFHESVREAYFQMVKMDQVGRWVVVDGNQEIESVTAKVWKEVQEKFFA